MHQGQHGWSGARAKDFDDDCLEVEVTLKERVDGRQGGGADGVVSPLEEVKVVVGWWVAPPLEVDKTPLEAMEAEQWEGCGVVVSLDVVQEAVGRWAPPPLQVLEIIVGDDAISHDLKDEDAEVVDI